MKPCLRNSSKHLTLNTTFMNLSRVLEIKRSVIVKLCNHTPRQFDAGVLNQATHSIFPLLWRIFFIGSRTSWTVKRKRSPTTSSVDHLDSHCCLHYNRGMYNLHHIRSSTWTEILDVMEGVLTISTSSLPRARG